MQAPEPLADLFAHMHKTTGLSAVEVLRIVDEVLTYFSESVDEFVVRRHRELKAEHLKNEAIFDQIAAELRTRRFAAPPLTARQIRRLIYG